MKYHEIWTWWIEQQPCHITIVLLEVCDKISRSGKTANPPLPTILPLTNYQSLISPHLISLFYTLFLFAPSFLTTHLYSVCRRKSRPWSTSKNALRQSSCSKLFLPVRWAITRLEAWLTTSSLNKCWLRGRRLFQKLEMKWILGMFCLRDCSCKDIFANCILKTELSSFTRRLARSYWCSYQSHSTSRIAVFRLEKSAHFDLRTIVFESYSIQLLQPDQRHWAVTRSMDHSSKSPRNNE